MTWGEYMALGVAAQKARTAELLRRWARNAERQADDDYRFDAEEEARDGWTLQDGT